MKVTLTEETIEEIADYVETYTEASGEPISEGLIKMTIDLLVSKYVSLKSYPSTYSHAAIESDVEQYFADHTAQIAYKIPEIAIGRMGVEGEITHSENGTTRTYSSGDALRNAFPDVVPMARVI